MEYSNPVLRELIENNARLISDATAEDLDWFEDHFCSVWGKRGDPILPLRVHRNPRENVAHDTEEDSGTVSGSGKDSGSEGSDELTYHSLVDGFMNSTMQDCYLHQVALAPTAIFIQVKYRFQVLTTASLSRRFR